MIRPIQSGRAAGFMLVEVVMALAITALAFGFAFRGLSGAFDRLGKDHNSMIALLLAESTLDRVGYDIAINAGESSGSTKDGFSWSVQTSPYTPAASPAAGSLMGYVVQVTVGWKERSNPRQVRLTTLRLAYRDQGS